MTDEQSLNNRRGWTTLWDRPNQRVLILATSGRNHHWASVTVDASGSVDGVYTIWRSDDSVLMAAEIRLDNDSPIGFPHHLLDARLLGSETIWPNPDMPSFIWWHAPIDSTEDGE